MPTKPMRVVVSGGGTGGHLFPALAIADELKAVRPDVELLFVGTRGHIEARVVPQRGYSFAPIWISGFQRRRLLPNMLVPLKVLVALAQSFFLIRRFRPSVVLGTGGYVCGPVLAAAWLLHIPTAIHESNSYPGITTRLLASRVSRLFTAFNATWQRLSPRVPALCTGTPVRKDLLHAGSTTEARTRFSLDPGKQTLLVLGGSLGAASLNEALLECFQQIVAQNRQIIWQTGMMHVERVRKALGPRTDVWIGPFIDRMDDAYAAADLVLCRAGATTIAELTTLGKPSVLIPYPLAAEDHQTVNARTLEEAGAAIIIADRELRHLLEPTILGLLSDPVRLQQMGGSALRLGSPDAAATIARELIKLAS